MIDIKQHSLYKHMEFENVFSSIFRIYLKKFLVLFGFSFAFVFAAQMLLYHFGFYEISGLTDPEEILRVLSKLMNKIVVVSVPSVVLYGILNSFLINYIFKSDTEPKLQISNLFVESIKKYAIHLIFFFVLSYLIIGLGTFIGVFALIVGAFVAMAYLGVVLLLGGAIVVAEEKNALDTIGRCFNLAHKDFWSAFGTAVLFIIIIIVSALVLNSLINILVAIVLSVGKEGSQSFVEALNIRNLDLGIWEVVLNSLVSALTYPLIAILSVVLYFKLKFTEDRKQQSIIN